MSKKSLIVVESPSKAKTIEKYLDNKFDVIACVGHVKDLPSSNLGIDIDNDFEMTLNVLPNRKDFIKELSNKLYEWTNKRWIILLSKKKGLITKKQEEKINKEKIIENVKKSKFYNEILDILPDAELLDFKANEIKDD